MKRPWMPLYVADYIADTRHLTVEEHGAYLLLTMHYWATGGLPAEDFRLQAIACMNDTQWQRSRDVLASLFDENWRHKRIEAELEKVRRISNSRKRAGKLGGSSKSKSEANAIANAEQLNVQLPTHSHSHSHIRKKESCSNEFERFWKAYPRRVGKKVAEKAFAKALRETSASSIIEALARQTSSWTDPKFIPHPATWLNAGRWADEVGEASTGPPPPEYRPPPGSNLPTHEEMLARHAERTKAEGATGACAELLAPSVGISGKKQNGVDTDHIRHTGIRRMGEIFPSARVDPFRNSDA